MDLFLGLDLGTSNLKALVMTDTGAIVARGAASYPLLRPRPGWAVQYPGTWWAALVEVLADLRARAVPLERVEAIGLSGQMHGLVLLDSAGNAVGPCQTWADARCAAEARLLERRVGPPRGPGPQMPPCQFGHRMRSPDGSGAAQRRCGGYVRAFQ